MPLTGRQLNAKNSARKYFQQGAGAGAAAIGGGDAPADPKEAATRNVIGFGIGPKIKSGLVLSGENAVRVYVRAKIPRTEVPQGQLVPAAFDGLPTDVIEVGDVIAYHHLKSWQRFGRHRPTDCGVSVGHFNITAGTLGCAVNYEGRRCLLSNNHVLADCNKASITDEILQQGPTDGGSRPGDAIARLSHFKRIDFTGIANDIDAAVAELLEAADLTSDIVAIGAPRSTTRPAVQYLSVRKHGRTTGHTVGVVMDVSADLWVNYGAAGKAWFEDQLAIQGVGSAPFSQGGDSGSLIVDAVTIEPVGLLFAGGTAITFANPIDAVLNYFSATIA